MVRFSNEAWFQADSLGDIGDVNIFTTFVCNMLYSSHVIGLPYKIHRESGRDDGLTNNLGMEWVQNILKLNFP